MEDDKNQLNQYNNTHQISNTSLVINHLENAFQHNQNQIDLMENFIKSKTNQIANLQAYLISEFQAIQNSKARNKNIQKILIASTIPLLQEIARSLQSFKEMLLPFSTVAFSFVTALHLKSKQLLSEKQSIINRQAQTIKELNEMIQNGRKPKDMSYSRKVNIANQLTIQQKKEGSDNNQKRTQKVEISYSISNLQKLVQPQHSDRSKSKTPNKLSKYEQYYQAILDKKQIKYHCEHILSPRETNIQIPKNKDPNNEVKYERKDYIKQKIQKIKIRTQCKQRRNKFDNT